jgi:hypothetical protein
MVNLSAPWLPTHETNPTKFRSLLGEMVADLKQIRT